MADKVGDLYAELKLRKDNFQKNLNVSQKNIKKFKKAANDSFKIVKGAIVALGVAIGAITAKSATMAKEFDKNMREVNTLARLGEEQFNDLKKAVISLSNRLGKDSTEMAKALYQIVSAGYSGNEAMRLLETGIEMAIGGVAGQTESVDALTSVMNAYSKSVGESKQVGDTFFQTIKYGKTTMTELAGAIGNVATPAALAGVSFEELSAAIAALSIVGVRTDKAVIGLRQLMMGVIKPTENAKRAAAQMGLQFDLASLQSKGLAGFLKSVVDATGGAVDEMAKLFPNVRAITALLPLTTNASGKFADIQKRMTTESGALNDAVKEMNKSFARQYEMTSNKVSNIMKALGAEILPMVSAGFEGLNPALDSTMELMSGIEGEGKDMAFMMKNLGTWIGKTGIGLMRFVNNARELMTDFGAHMTNILAGTLETLSKIPKFGGVFKDAAHEVRMLNVGFVEQGVELQKNEEKYNQMIANLGKEKEILEEINNILPVIPPVIPPIIPPGTPSVVEETKEEKQAKQEAWNAEAKMFSDRAKLQQEMHEWAVEYKKDQKDLGISIEELGSATGEMLGTMIQSGGSAEAMIKRLIGQLIRMNLLKSLGPLGGVVGGFMQAFGMQEGGMTNMPMMNMRPDLAVANENPNTPEMIVPIEKFKDLIQVNVQGAATADILFDATKLPDDVKDKFTRDVIKPALSRDARR